MGTVDKIRIITKLTKLDGASLRRRSAIKIPSLTLRIFLREMIASFFDSLHRIPVDSERRCAKFFALARVIDEVGGGGGGIMITVPGKGTRSTWTRMDN